MKKIAVVYIAHDGFTSLYTGVGTVARDFLFSFPEVVKQIKKKKNEINIELFVATLKYKKECFGFSPEVRNQTLQFIKKQKNIHLVELINGSSGTKSYGYIDLWKNACVSSATFIYTLSQLKKYEKIIVICVDTPFTQVANYYLAQYSDKRITFVWLPQSTVLIHRVDSGLGKTKVKNYIKERYDWERGVIDLANHNQQVKVGYIGEFMRNHLQQEYGARETSLISLKNGLFFKRLNKNKLSQKKLAVIIRKLGVPINRPLIFAFGRAESYKGLDLVIKNADELIRKYGYFVFILASPYSMDDPYLNVLNKLASRYKPDIKIVYALDFITPHYLMQWKNTKIIALLSRAEPYGLIPTEARYYRNPNSVILTSDLDGFKEQVENGKNGFKTPLDDNLIRNSFAKIARLSKKKISTISDQGYKKATENSQVEINSRFILSLIKNL